MKLLLITLIPAVLLGRAASSKVTPSVSNATGRAAAVAAPPPQPAFPRLPDVKAVMNSSTATFGRISNDVTKIHSHVEQLEAQNAGKLAERKAKNEALLKAQASQNRELQGQNDQLALEIAALRNGNQDLRSKAQSLQNGNEALRKEMIAVNAKVLEASGFIQTTLNLTNDAKAADLAVLRGTDEVASRKTKIRHRHHHGEEEEEAAEEDTTVGADSDAAEDADAKEADEKEEVDDSSDAEQVSSAVAVKEEEATDKASAKDAEEDQKDDDDNSGSDKDDDADDKASAMAPKSGGTSKLQTGTAHKSSGFLRALHRGKGSAGIALVELTARTHRYHRRFRRDADGADGEADDEDSQADDGNDSSDGEDETPKEEAKEVVTENVDAASDQMLTDLKNEILRLHAQNADGVAKMEAEFVKKHKAEDTKMREIVKQQKALNASKASFVETQHRLNVAVHHLEGTRSKVEAQMKNLGGFLRNLGHFLTAPAKEDPSKLIKAMPALISETEESQ